MRLNKKISWKKTRLPPLFGLQIKPQQFSISLAQSLTNTIKTIFSISSLALRALYFRIKNKKNIKIHFFYILFFIFSIIIPAHAIDEKSLTKDAQNPLSNLTNLLFQNNFNFGFIYKNQLQYNLNVELNVPIELKNEWRFITRPIIPIIYQVDIFKRKGHISGMGDINPLFFLASPEQNKMMVGLGTSLYFPTATAFQLGYGKYSAGPGFVFVWLPESWVISFSAANVWSYAGKRNRRTVKQLTSQAFINYNLEKGWFLISAPLITANWQVKPKERWTIPVGGGVGRICIIGKHGLDLSLQSYYNVVAPKTLGPNWSIRFVLNFLFPE